MEVMLWFQTVHAYFEMGRIPVVYKYWKSSNSFNEQNSEILDMSLKWHLSYFAVGRNEENRNG